MVFAIVAVLPAWLKRPPPVSGSKPSPGLGVLWFNVIVTLLRLTMPALRFANPTPFAIPSELKAVFPLMVLFKSVSMAAEFVMPPPKRRTKLSLIVLAMITARHPRFPHRRRQGPQSWISQCSCQA